MTLTNGAATECRLFCYIGIDKRSDLSPVIFKLIFFFTSFVLSDADTRCGVYVVAVHGGADRKQDDPCGS